MERSPQSRTMFGRVRQKSVYSFDTMFRGYITKDSVAKGTDDV